MNKVTTGWFAGRRSIIAIAIVLAVFATLASAWVGVAVVIPATAFSLIPPGDAQPTAVATGVATLRRDAVLRGLFLRAPPAPVQIHSSTI